MPQFRSALTKDRQIFLKSWLFVVAQFALIALCLVGVQDAISKEIPVWRLSLASLLTAAGLALGLSAVWSMGSNTFSVLPTPVPHGQLCQRGPYRWLCHPMYSAVLLVCSAAILITPTPLKLILLLGLIIVLVGKLKYEESLLTKNFQGYSEYAAMRYRLVPGVW